MRVSLDLPRPLPRLVDPKSVPQLPARMDSLELLPAEKRATETANRNLAESYPDFGMAFRDPDRFFADMSDRFQAQRKRTPEDPHQFDFSDVGMPLVDDLSRSLDVKIAQVEQMQAARAARRLPGVPGRTYQPHEFRVGLEYLHALRAEVNQLKSEGRITYRRTLELAHFASPALGHFDVKTLSVKDRMLLGLDRYVQGLEKAPIAKEYLRYQNNDVQRFPRPSVVVEKAQGQFSKALADRTRLRTIVYPTMKSVGEEPFMRLMAHRILLVGVGESPISADGVLRPSKDFMLHDYNHDAAIFAQLENYVGEHQLSEAQFTKLRGMMDVWREELNAEIEKIPNKNLRNAASFFTFNTHHDRGFPLVPSTYTKLKRFEIVPLQVQIAIHLAGQPVHFKNPAKWLPLAQEWCTKFWLARLDQEQALLNAGKAVTGASAPTSLGWEAAESP